MCFKGPAVFSGYIGEPDLTAAAFDADGFYRTGDLFESPGRMAATTASSVAARTPSCAAA
jgi:non-ribosomal peptide synthetase component E (peptide arylation enzyme)